MMAMHAVAQRIRVRMAMSLKRFVTISATMLLFLHMVVSAFQVGPMPTVERSLIESSTVPDWLYGFRAVQLELNVASRLELVHITVVSSEQEERAALIGTLRNLGQPLSGVALTLSYLDSKSGSTVRSVSNTAFVSEVGHGGFLPFRFLLPLRADLPREVLTLRMSVKEGVLGSRRPIRGTIRPGYSFRGRSTSGVLVAGAIEIASDGTLLFDQSEILITLVLLDKAGILLDVLAGGPMSVPSANLCHFELASFLPIRKRVESIQVYLEAESSTR